MGHREPSAVGELLGLLLGVVVPVREVDSLGQVAQGIVRRRLIGDDVNLHPATQQFGEHSRRVAEHSDAEGPPLGLSLRHAAHRLVQIIGPFVEVAIFDATLQSRRIDVDAQAHAVIHHDGEGLRAPHAPDAAREGQCAREGAPETLGRHRRERLVGTLENSLGTDVDPRPGRHLTVHGEPEGLQPAKLRPRRPVAHEVGVGDEHSRCPLVSLEDPHRTPRLNQHRLVGLERREGSHQRVEAGPVARRSSGAAVDDQVIGTFGDFGVEIILQHAQCRLLGPAQRAEGRAASCADGSCTLHVGSFFYRTSTNRRAVARMSPRRTN